MKVLLNALQAGNRSGTGTYAAELAQELTTADHGVEVTVAWPIETPSPLPEDRVLLKNGRNALGRICYDQWSIAADAKRIGAALIHYPANVGTVLGRHTSVVTIHDLSFYRHPEFFTAARGAYYRSAVKAGAKHARRIVADSECTARDLVDCLQVDRHRVDVVPLGVSTRFQPASATAQDEARRLYRLPEKFILYVGAIEPRKNLPRLVAAWDSVAGAIEHDLVIAGRRAWKCGELDRSVAEAKHQNRIRFPGFIEPDRLNAVLSSAAVFAYTPLWEGFGLPPLEAMACGTPVLTSKTSSLPEVVGDCAVTVDPTNSEAIAEGLRTLATDDALRIELAARGKRHAAAFTWEKTAERTAESYRRAVEA